MYCMTEEGDLHAGCGVGRPHLLLIPATVNPARHSTAKSIEREKKVCAAVPHGAHSNAGRR